MENFIITMTYLLIGVLVGTYSSVFVASPFLLWMTGGTKELEKGAA